MRVAVLIKQIPAFEAMTLGPDGRLVREGLPLEMNAYCRRAVAQAVELVAARGGEIVVFTLGPASADDALREALAWGDEHGVAPEQMRGVHVSDPAFAGSDTLATARALHAALAREGDFDLVLCGRNSVDADTGQVGPELAELLDLPFVTAARELLIEADTGVVEARSEGDDGYTRLRTSLPVVISCAERLIEPSKVDPPERAAVDAARIRLVGSSDLGPGPWGQYASPTSVGPVRVMEHTRARARRPDVSVEEQVAAAVAQLDARGALTPSVSVAARPLPPGRELRGQPIVVVVEPARARLSGELLGAAAELAVATDGHVVAFGTADLEPAELGARGADAVIDVDARVEENVATALTEWCTAHEPWAVLAPSTTWGREVASRAAARLGAGLTGDAVELEVDERGRLVAWKPAFGGALVAAILCRSAIQMATVRAGMMPLRRARVHTPKLKELIVTPRERVTVLERSRDDDLDVLADADVVITVGTGVDPSCYDDLEPLRELLGGELGATRKVTDKGWMPRARQVGITGRSIAPRLLVSIGASGKFNHSVGFRNAGTVLAINPDATAPIFGFCDVGIVAEWTEAVPALVRALDALQPASRSGA
jgi:electron transfer flavoprotein alpha subunit